MEIDRKTWHARWFFWVLNHSGYGGQSILANVNMFGTNICQYIRVITLRAFFFVIVPPSVVLAFFIVFFILFPYSTGGLWGILVMWLGVIGFLLGLVGIAFLVERLKEKNSSNPGPFVTYLRDLKQKTCTIVRFNEPDSEEQG